MKYAIKVRLDQDHVYVTRPTGKMYEVEPVLYDSYEKAEKAALIWGSCASIVEYLDYPTGKQK